MSTVCAGVGSAFQQRELIVRPVHTLLQEAVRSHLNAEAIWFPERLYVMPEKSRNTMLSDTQHTFPELGVSLRKPLPSPGYTRRASSFCNFAMRD